MDDKELFEIWRVSENREKKVFENHKGTYEQLAKRQSNDIFRRIKRNVIIEFIVTVIITILPYFFFSLTLYLDEMNAISISIWLWFVIVTIFPLIGFVIQIKCLYVIAKVNKSTIIESLKSKIIILSGYIKRMSFIIGVISPAFFFISFYMGLFHGLGNLSDFENEKLLKILGVLIISILVVFVLIWLLKRLVYKLYYKFYGKYLKRIQEIYDNLVEEEIH